MNSGGGGLGPPFFFEVMMGLSRFWTCIIALFLSLAWLLPNHSIPWLGFHGDAWASVVLWCIGIVVAWRSKFLLSLNRVGVIALLISTLPLFQYAAGKIVLFGIAWINFIYLYGFALSIIVSVSWFRVQRDQLSNIVFMAVGVAAIISVFIQLTQFFYLDLFGMWALPGLGKRQFANMAQPNNLASLLLLGMLAVIWGYLKRIYAGYIAAFLLLMMLSGLVLTESRTVWVTFALLTLCIAWKHELVPSRKHFFVTFLLLSVYVVLSLSLKYIYAYFGFDEIGGGASRAIAGDTRWIAWKLFFKAILLHPFAGYGWGQVAIAQFSMIDEKIILGGNFLQAHNLFIDLFLWNGLLIGGLLSCIVVFCCIRVFFGIVNLQQLIQFFFVLVLLVHSMLEYPLQYAYFLLPLGLIFGELTASVGMGVVLLKKKAVSFILIVIAGLMLLLTINDYFRIEERFYGLRFEIKKIPTSIPNTPPKARLLTQWTEYIRFARIEPSADILKEDIETLKAVASTMPSAYIMYKLASVLAYQSEPSEAQIWLRRICQTTPKEHCDLLRTQWEQDSVMSSEIKAVTWPAPSSP